MRRNKRLANWYREYRVRSNSKTTYRELGMSGRISSKTLGPIFPPLALFRNTSTGGVEDGSCCPASLATESVSASLSMPAGCCPPQLAFFYYCTKLLCLLSERKTARTTSKATSSICDVNKSWTYIENYPPIFVWEDRFDCASCSCKERYEASEQAINTHQGK